MPPTESALCLTCADRGKQRHTAQGYLTCTPCADRIADTLTEIRQRHATLATPEALLPAITDDTRKTGYASQSPARDRVIAMLDTRTTAMRPGDPHSVLGVLRSWAELLREDTNQTTPAEPTTVDSETKALQAWLDWITRQPWVADLADELRQLRDQLRSETGEPNPKPVGHCINTWHNPDGHLVECEAPLFAPRAGTAIRCHACHREYDGLDLVKLELAQEAAS